MEYSHVIFADEIFNAFDIDSDFHIMPYTSSPASFQNMPVSRVFSHEIPSLMSSVQEALRPFAGPGEMLIWRAPFHWHNDNGVLPNHFESHSLDDLCEEFGYEVVHDFNHATIVRSVSR